MPLRVRSSEASVLRLPAGNKSRLGMEVGTMTSERRFWPSRICVRPGRFRPLRNVSSRDGERRSASMSRVRTPWRARVSAYPVEQKLFPSPAWAPAKRKQCFPCFRALRWRDVRRERNASRMGSDGSLKRSRRCFPEARLRSRGTDPKTGSPVADSTSSAVRQADSRTV